jgi:hypothetical protein
MGVSWLSEAIHIEVHGNHDHNCGPVAEVSHVLTLWAVTAAAASAAAAAALTVVDIFDRNLCVLFLRRFVCVSLSQKQSF